MIVSQNSLLNQYIPTFLIQNLVDGQIVVYDSTRKAFINASALTPGTAPISLGQLSNLSAGVDSTGQNGQALLWNSTSGTWQNGFVDFNSLLNKPTSASYDFIGLSDTTKPSIPNGYVMWDPTGTTLIYSATIPAANIQGLSAVATSGNYNDLINKPILNTGTVTSVSVTNANGISGTVINPTTIPAITLTLGNITPTSVTTTGEVSAGTVVSTGTITGSNLSGMNTGDQTITLTGDVTGSGTATVNATLANTTVVPGSYVGPNLTVDSKGRITSISNGLLDAKATEIVIFKYSTGSSGTFNTIDALVYQSLNVEVTIVDPVNCIATYAFKNKINPPISIVTYGQVYSTNNFAIKYAAGLPTSNVYVAGGGTPDNPTIISGFTVENTITLQTRMSDTGASASFNQRAYLLIAFGF